MTANATSVSNVINLKGSTDLVTEFFDYSVNSILYQRAIYPPETFARDSKYGLAMMTTTDTSLREYINTIMGQLKNWLLDGRVKKLVLVVKGVESNDTLERWVFDCESTGNSNDNNNDNSSSSSSTSKKKKDTKKSQKEIQNEIQAVLRQITASVTFLPLLNEPCTFDLLIYADKNAEVPITWEDSDPCYIKNSEDVQLRSFDTKVHKVGTTITYKIDDDDL